MKLLSQRALLAVIILIVFVLGLALVTSNIESMFDYCEEHPNDTCCRKDTLCTVAGRNEHCIKECQWAMETGKLTACYCNWGMMT